MKPDISAVKMAFSKDNTLAVADQILMAPLQGSLLDRLDGLLDAIFGNGRSRVQICKTLVRLGMNLVGRDAEIVGYGADELQTATRRVFSVIDGLDSQTAGVMRQVVEDFLDDMESVNMKDSLSGLLSERIRSGLNRDNPGRSFLELFRQQLQSSVYGQMLREGYCKFGNDYARGLEYLRHYGFCQVSTNPVLAAKAFDEDPRLTEALIAEIDRHDDWKQNPEAHADEMAMTATLIALWPNLSIFRPLALHTQLNNYMVSFQLNPNIADQAAASIEDARNAYKLAANYLKDYDRMLGRVDRGSVGPCIVFKISGGHEAARRITTELNAEGIGTNNTVVFSVSQEVRLILDAYEGKARALKNGRPLVRTYETNMGGRFVSHLREVAAGNIIRAAVEKSGEDNVLDILDKLAVSLRVEKDVLDKLKAAGAVEKAQRICAFRFLKTLNHPDMIRAAEAAGQTADVLIKLEEDLIKAGTLVARRVYWLFFAPQNRPKWVRYLKKTYGLGEQECELILSSMDILPASKRIPNDTLHALGKANICHTEFPNHQRDVESTSVADNFNLQDYRESILKNYDPEVSRRLRQLHDFCRGYDVTPALKNFLLNNVGIDVGSWQTEGLEATEWPQFGPVRKTIAEFKAAYDAFAARCVEIADAVVIT